MATLTMPEAFLQDVIEHPDDDAPRLIFADWLEERGDPARAEFIRVQVALEKHEAAIAQWGDRFPTPPVPEGFLLFSRREALRRRERVLLGARWGDWLPRLRALWQLAGDVDPNGSIAVVTDPPDRGRAPAFTVAFRRGFVAEITCTLDAFYGGPCWLCGGRGGTDGLEKWDCPDCHGTGRTPGHGPALVRAAPLERVTLSDRAPFCYTAAGRPTYLWRCVTSGYGNERNLLPVALFDALPGHEHGHVAEYAARQEAESALSEACLVWARAQPAASSASHSELCPACHGNTAGRWQECPVCRDAGRVVTS